MTHKDIYTKFMIEYDKANVTSSYPSLTKYEIATLLDKAYLALIALKITGNNLRQTGFEADLKAIEDIRPLIKHEKKFLVKSPGYVSNQYQTVIPEDSLYVIQTIFNLHYGDKRPMDNQAKRSWPGNLVSHEIAERFFATPYNMPWIKQPVYYLEDKYIYFLIDSLWDKMYDIENMTYLDIKYIKKPAKFAVLIPQAPSEEPQPGGDTPDNPDITDTPTEVVWTLSDITWPTFINNPLNQYLLQAYATSNTGDTIYPTFSITSGSQYATITSDGMLTILETSSADAYITVEARFHSIDRSISRLISVRYTDPDPIDPHPDDPEVWVIGQIRDQNGNVGPFNIENKYNAARFYANAWSTKQGEIYRTGSVAFINKDQNYFEITEDGMLRILPAAKDSYTSTILVRCKEDPDVWTIAAITVKYTFPQQSSDVLNGLDTFELDIDTIK